MGDITPTHGKILPNDRLPRELIDSLDLRNRLFYVLPDKLLRAIDNHLPDAVSKEDIELEARLSRLVKTDVAVRNEQPISCIRLAASVAPVHSSDCLTATDPNAVAAELTRILREVHASPE